MDSATLTLLDIICLMYYRIYYLNCSYILLTKYAKTKSIMIIFHYSLLLSNNKFR